MGKLLAANGSIPRAPARAAPADPAEHEADAFASRMLLGGERFDQRMRVHTGPEAVRANDSFQSLAFTVGNHVYFGRDQFRPDTLTGRRLIAHEYAHTLQQQKTGPRIQFQTAAAERARVADLVADYRTSVARADWEHAARVLNGFSEDDIRTRVRQLNHEQRIQMYAAAVASMPTFHQRVSGEIARQDSEAERVGGLTFDYNSARSGHNWARAAELLNAFNDIDVRQKLDALSSADLSTLAGAAGGFTRISAGAAASRNARALAFVNRQIARMDPAMDPQLAAQALTDIVQDLDLTDRRNLQSVTTTIAARFGAAAGIVLAQFFARLERPQSSSEADRNIALLQVGRRGPYGQYGPGVILPVLANAARPLLPAVEGGANALAGAGAFLGGVFEGMGTAVDQQHIEMLRTRLAQSAVLSTVFPPIFAAGAVVGVVEDVVDAVKGIYHLIGNLGEFVDAIGSLMRLIVSPEFASVGHDIGREVGREYGERISHMAEGNVVRFTFDFGRLIGPTIIYIVLAFVGVPEVAASALVERILPLIRPILERFPRLLRIAETMAVALRDRAAGTVLGRAQQARRVAVAAAVDRTIAGVLARISQELSAETFTGFAAALQADLATEGVGLAGAVNAIPAESAAMRELFQIAYDGMNNRSVWDSVLRDVAREAERVHPPFSNPSITSPYTQAIWNLAEKRAQSATLIPRANPIHVIEQGANFDPFRRRFYDLGVSTVDHGNISHLMQDLVVDRAFEQRGRYVDAERFRRLLGQLTTPYGPNHNPLRSALWNALYDGQHGLNEPERVIALLRRVFGSAD